MKTDQQFDTNRKLDKTTALFSLAAAEKRSDNLCLTAEEMAALIDGRYPAEELADKWQHLQDCDTCYQEWFLVKSSLRKAKKCGRIYSMNLSKKLGYIGSALAAAASIVVYLNIYGPPESLQKEADIGQPQIILQMNKVESPEDKLAAVDAATDKIEDYSQLELAPVESPLLKAKSSLATSMKTAPQPALIKEKKRTARAIAETGNSIGGMAARRLPAVNEWLENLSEECRSGRKNLAFWVDARNRGEELMDHRDTIEQRDMRDKFTAVFSLVDLVRNEASVDQQCTLILAELTANETTR